MLDISKSFFNYLESQYIRYCHWKSNNNLDKALNGETDLDLLVHPEDKEKFYKSVLKFNIKQILSPPNKQFPNMEDWLGFDFKTGKLIHLHIHYKLILGQRYIKNHHLPLEDLFFNNLILKKGVYIPCPELELLILIIRAHMKIDAISILKHFINDSLSRAYTAFPKAIEVEFSNLIATIDISKFYTILFKTKIPIQPEIFTDFIKKFTSNKLKAIDIIITRKRILNLLQEFRRDKGKYSRIKYIGLVIRNSKIISRVMKQPKKRLLERGKTFSIVGADGSGKSTLVKGLHEWLSWKLDVKKRYFGIPKNRLIKFASFLIRGFRKVKIIWIAKMIENFLWLYIARTRYCVSIADTNTEYKGIISITDRFPLKDFYIMDEPMDGPRIHSGNSSLQDILSLKEKKYYNKISIPNTIFILQIPFEELRKRKSDLDYEIHKKKSDAVNKIKADKIKYLIDANKSYEIVLLNIKKKIWEKI